MHIIIRLICRNRIIMSELLLSTFFINLLVLAIPLYIIQVMTRYIGGGIDATLMTLTIGVLLALILEFLFRHVRLKIAGVVCVPYMKKVSEELMYRMNHLSWQSLNQNSHAKNQSIFQCEEIIAAAYSGSMVTYCLDLPFIFLFILILFIISPLLCLIVLLLAAGMWALSLQMSRITNTIDHSIRDGRIMKAGLSVGMIRNAEVVRTFPLYDKLLLAWNKVIGFLRNSRSKLDQSKAFQQQLMLSIMALSTILIYAVGAKIVVLGGINIGLLIGANVLATRILMPLSRLSDIKHVMKEAERALNELASLRDIEAVDQEKNIIKDVKGNLKIVDFGFVYPKSRIPLFESLNVSIKSGQFVVIVGPNASGKSTLMHLCMRLLIPKRGQILVDDKAIEQLSRTWWKKQVCYLPQDMTFFQGSIRENILLTSKIKAERLGEILALSDLKDYLDATQEGLEYRLDDWADKLSKGIQKRIAIARSLVADGPFVFFDEPTEELDNEGIKAVHHLLDVLHRKGKTIIVCSHDEEIIERAQIKVDLSHKPVPLVI
jgi:ATP-binding cassette subfamily C protein LapB